MDARAVINVFARFPRRGHVKTRLAQDVGTHRALALHRRMTVATLATVARVPAVERLLWTAGPHWHPAFAAMPAAARRVQPPGDLGHRMRIAIDAALRRGLPGIIVGTDCPDLATRHLECAIAALAASDVVLGPATDGGYYLIGLRRAGPSLFRHLAWGTGDVRRQTLVRARHAGLSATLLEPLTDVDELADLRGRPGQ